MYNLWLLCSILLAGFWSIAAEGFPLGIASSNF
jgi:hypothetical protein